jgi:hypothetical protein
MIVWKKYPQDEDAHPERPWWKRDVTGELKGWSRRDAGAFAYGEDALESMAEFDAENPPPAPPPKCGQVWVSESSEKLITRIERVDNGGPTVNTYVWAGTDRYAGTWPPEGYSLVYGPFSPWTSTRETD